MRGISVVVVVVASCTTSRRVASTTSTPAAPATATRLPVSTADPEFATAISADGATLYFNRLDSTRERFELLVAERTGDGWRTPSPVWFAHPPDRDVDPFLSFDGRTIYFSSNRPLPNTSSTDFNLWSAATVPGAAPAPLPDTINTPAMEVYGGFDRAGRFVFARTIDNTTRVFEVDRIGDPPRDVAPFTTASLTNPMLSPDGRLLVVASTELPGYGGADLFVLFRDGERWSAPYNLGPAVNSAYPEFAPAFSPDQRTLFFTSERVGIVDAQPPEERRPGDLYEISTAAVEALRLASCANLGATNAHGLAWVDDRVVLFGGADQERVRETTHTLDHATWRAHSGRGPAARTFPVFVTHGTTALLFGGNPVLFGPDRSPPLLDDTWTFDGTWRRRDVSGPSRRAEASAAFDPRRNKVVLFGGYERDDLGHLVALDDLWEWDGMRWQRPEIHGARPRARYGAAMAYDETSGVMLVFGGSDGKPDGETWAWDGQRWTLLDATAPATYNAVAAWDGERVIRFGGWNGTRRVGETWGWTGTRWRRLAQSGPSARNHSALVATPTGVLLVGGHDGTNVFGDVWIWRRGGWTPICAAAPRARVANEH